MKLDILMPHYDEPWELVEPFFASMRLQLGVDFSDYRVIMVNDGDKVVFDTSLFTSYPFAVEYYVMPHGGVSAARNYAFDHSDADYVMYCDCDDGFVNLYGLHLLQENMEKGYDAITSVFIEEHRMDDGTYRILRKERDATFVHGKVYKRQYLIDKELRFNPKLTIHEDGYFNCLALMCTENKKHIDMPFYIWKWRANSVAAKGDETFVLRTYGHVMKTRAALVKEAKRRGFVENAKDFVAKTVLDSYYDFNKPTYLKPQNKWLVDIAEKEFRKFYMKYRADYNSCSIDKIAEVMYISRSSAYINGLRVEQRTLNEWLNHIVYEVTE